VTKYGIDDLTASLSDRERGYFADLHGYAVANGLKIKVENAAYFRYIYKKEYVLALRTGPTRIIVPFGLKGVSDKLGSFLGAAERQADADEAVSYIIDNIYVCDGCAANTASRERDLRRGIVKKCGDYWVDIRGVKRHVCSANCINKYKFPDDSVFCDYDAVMLKRMVDIRMMQINEAMVE
jgi:hypothetical protein